MQAESKENCYPIFRQISSDAKISFNKKIVTVSSLFFTDC